MFKPAQRRLLIAGLAGGALLVAGCAQDPPGANGEEDNGDGDVVLRFSWWGADDRHSATQAAVDAFEDANPEITVEVEYSDFGGYWDRLATQTAGGSAPDVMQMSDAYLAEYADRNALLPLSEVDGLDVSALDEDGLSSGVVDGELYAIQAGANFPALLANVDLFEEAGVELPDDASWTWDDYQQTAEEISANTPDGIFGTDQIMPDPASGSWLIQNGVSMFSEEGEVGFEPQDLVPFFERIQSLEETGAAPSAGVASEQMNAGPENWGVSIGESAMAFTWSTRLEPTVASIDSEVELLRLPSDTDESGLYQRGAMYWSVANTSQHPEEAIELVDFLVNDEAAADELLADRGIPLNTEIMDYISDDISEADQELFSFVNSQAEAFGPPPPTPPEGGGDYENVFLRAITDVMFDRLSAEEAAEQVHTELL